MSEQKLLVDLNLNGNRIKNVLIDVVATDPVAPVAGQAWYNSTSGKLKYRDSSATRIIAIDGELTTSSIASAALTTDLDASAGATQLATASAIKTYIAAASINQTGFTSFDGSGNYYSIAGGNLTLLRTAHGRVQGVTATCNSGQSVALTANATNYVYFGTDGVLRVTTAATGQMYNDYVFLFQAMTDGTNYGVVFENHPANFPTEVAHFAHHTIGAVIGLAPGSLTVGADCVRVTTGTGGAATDRQIKVVGAAGFYDHGIMNTIPDSAGAAVTWYQAYTNASGYWNMYANQASLAMMWNNAGTPTALTVNKHGIYALYCSKHDPNTSLPVYIAVMGNVEYGNLSAAESAVSSGAVPVPTNELARWEVGKLGYAIIQNNASGGQIVEIIIQKQTLNAAYAGGGNVGSAALTTVSTTNFAGVLSSSDVTAQAALDTIDDYDLARFITDATTTRTISDAGRGKIIRFTSNSAVTFTIVPVSVAGHQTGFIQEGEGQVTLVLSGVTATPSTALKSLRKGSYVHITYLTTTLVQLSGELTS